MQSKSGKPWLDGPIVTTSLSDHIFKSRSILDRDAFLSPKWPDHLHDPFLLPDCNLAVERIRHALKHGEKIGVVGDYDMDGTPAAALMAGYLRLMGGAVVVILPTREDGYGFSPNFVDRLTKQGVGLIITVDCGIRDFAAVEHAQKLQCDVIIVDHHECASSLPNATAVVNPKRTDSRYPFSELCGTGVAFKLLQAVNRSLDSSQQAVGEAWLAWSLDLVALATIGDMVPLVNENRVLVIYGMKVLRRGKRIGLRRLLNSLEIEPSRLTYGDIAYKIIPKLNASGRLESMDDVLALLSVQTVEEADPLVKQILTRDTQRQLLSKSIYQQVKDQLATLDDTPIIVAYHDSWHPGVTGIVAGQLAREYNRPAAVFGSLNGELFRGSMRSVGGINLPILLEQMNDELVSYGGHAEAAGLSINRDKLLDFKTKLITLPDARTISTVATVTTDGTMQPDVLDFNEVGELDALSPWGMGNHEPTWSISSAQLQDVRWIGQDGSHLKATVRCVRGPLDVIYFGATAWQEFDWKKPVDVYGTLGINEFRGVKKPQLMVKGIYCAKD